jgi:RNase H-fold protein (predicted Holliday junction resolvase)
MTKKRKKIIDQKVLQNLELESERASKKEKSEPILAVDYGEKFCGIAFSPDGVLTLPVDVFVTEKIYKEIRDLIEIKKIKKLVFGLPLASDGQENEICAKVRALALACKNLIDEIYFENERFSTQNVKNFSSRDRVDDIAAAEILKFFLNRKFNNDIDKK